MQKGSVSPQKLAGRKPPGRKPPVSKDPAGKASVKGRPDYSPTPDRRYFVVRGRLWRLSNPSLEPEAHERLVSDLMTARRAVKECTDSKERIAARLRVDAAKRALGERGNVWWDDGAPDYNRKLAINTPYASWFTGS